MTTPRDLLRPLLAARRTPHQRRALADELRQIADEQELLAEAEERSGHRFRAAIAVPARKATGRPRGTGATFVRWEPPQGEGKGSRRSGKLHIGRALWQQLGEPARLDVQRQGSRLVLRPCGGGAGWAVVKPPQGMPRLSIGEEAADTLRLAEGRFDGRVEDGAIVAG